MRSAEYEKRLCRYYEKFRARGMSRSQAQRRAEVEVRKDAELINSTMDDAFDFGDMADALPSTHSHHHSRHRAVYDISEDDYSHDYSREDFIDGFDPYCKSTHSSRHRTGPNRRHTSAAFNGGGHGASSTANGYNVREARPGDSLPRPHAGGSSASFSGHAHSYTSRSQSDAPRSEYYSVPQPTDAHHSYGHAHTHYYKTGYNPFGATPKEGLYGGSTSGAFPFTSGSFPFGDPPYNTRTAAPGDYGYNTRTAAPGDHEYKTRTASPEDYDRYDDMPRGGSSPPRGRSHHFHGDSHQSRPEDGGRTGVRPATELYSLLGVSRTASSAEIKRAWHKLSLKLHPDRVAADKQKQAHERMTELNRAYDVLKDPSLRRLYDETGLMYTAV